MGGMITPCWQIFMPLDLRSTLDWISVCFQRHILIEKSCVMKVGCISLLLLPSCLSCLFNLMLSPPPFSSRCVLLLLMKMTAFRNSSSPFTARMVYQRLWPRQPPCCKVRYVGRSQKTLMTPALWLNSHYLSCTVSQSALLYFILHQKYPIVNYHCFWLYILAKGKKDVLKESAFCCFSV